MIRKSIKNASILIIDDSLVTQETVTMLLKENGYININVASDGRQALSTLEHLEPDLIILDLMMPNMDGFELCKNLQNNPKIRNVPILIQSSMEWDENVLKIFDYGASDFIHKPIRPTEVLARVRVHLEKRQLIIKMHEYQERLSKELEIAKQMQVSLLPSERQKNTLCKKLPINIASYNQTSSELGGDFWNFKQISEHEMIVYMIDFSGHGIAAALNVFRIQELIQSIDISEARQFPNILNKELAKILSVGQYATMVFAIINTQKMKLEYSIAGAPEPLMFCDNDFINFEHRQPPIGITDTIKYKLNELPYKHDSVLLLFSDALVETPNQEGDFISRKQLKKVMRTTNSPKTLISNLMLTLDNHRHSIDITDDLTLVSLKLL